MKLVKCISSKHQWYKDWFLLINDNGQEMWYDKCPYGVIELLQLTETIQYIGESKSGLTNGKYYETLDKEKGYEYFYFIDDDDRFVGIYKINYFGGAANFIEVTKERDDKINSILS